MSSACSRPRVTRRLTSSSASPRVIRPRRTASSTTSCRRSREIVTLFSSASRNACTLCSARELLLGALDRGVWWARARLPSAGPVYPRPCRLNPGAHRELDRGVVGEPQGETVLVASSRASGGQARRRGRPSAPRTSRWSIESVAVIPVEPDAVGELLVDVALAGADVEVAAEDERVVARPLDRAARPRASSSSSAADAVVLAWRLVTQRPQPSRAKAIVRRSGRRAADHEVACARRFRRCRRARGSGWSRPPRSRSGRASGARSPSSSSRASCARSSSGRTRRRTRARTRAASAGGTPAAGRRPSRPRRACRCTRARGRG